MKILFVHHGEVMGGAPVSLLNTILGLQEIADIDVKVLCVNYVMKKFFHEQAQVKVKKFAYPCKILGKVLIWGNIVHVQMLRMLIQEILQAPFSIHRQYAQFKAEKPDILHLNSAILFTTAIAGRLARIPIVWHVREILAGSRFNLRKILAGWFIRTWADKVIAISPEVKKSLGKVKAENVEVIYNFVDFSQFNLEYFDQIQEKKKFGIMPGEKLVVSLGGVAFRKGTVQLIEAMQYVGKNVRLIIAGPPLCKQNYSEQQKKSLNIKLQIEELLMKVGIKHVYNWEYQYRVQQTLNNSGKDPITFTGVLENIMPLIAACDMLVFAGTTPHFPRPVFEAWTMKKPVIAFDIPGIAEHIDDDIDGILVKPMTGRALGEAIDAVIDNDTRLQEMGEQGYKKAYTYFRKEVNIPKIWKIYQDLSQN